MDERVFMADQALRNWLDSDQILQSSSAGSTKVKFWTQFFSSSSGSKYSQNCDQNNCGDRLHAFRPMSKIVSEFRLDWLNTINSMVRTKSELVLVPDWLTEADVWNLGNQEHNSFLKLECRNCHSYANRSLNLVLWNRSLRTLFLKSFPYWHVFSRVIAYSNIRRTYGGNVEYGMSTFVEVLLRTSQIQSWPFLCVDLFNRDECPLRNDQKQA